MTKLYDWFMLIGGVGTIIIPIIMGMIAMVFLNKRQHKMRIASLLFGPKHEWSQGKGWIGLMDVGYVIAIGFIGAWRMNITINKFHKKQEMALMFPALNVDNNYLKLITEYRTFLYLSMLTMGIGLFGAIMLFIGMGIDKGWFNF
jgi:hypothetical protein